MIDHTANIVVIDPEGRYRAFIRLPHEPDKLLLAYRSLAAM
jgi:cytochrome oxidase Cu insertion factor (SCO1/SenC/PrrC family)